MSTTPGDSANEWFIQIEGKTYGPVDSKKLKSLAASGKITPDTPIRRGTNGKWSTCRQVSGLFKSIENVIIEQPASIVPSQSLVTTPPPSETPQKHCPYCGELISVLAVKCKHCGEFLDATLRSQRELAAAPKTVVAIPPSPAPARSESPVAMHLFQTTTVVMPKHAKWHGGTAAVLSFFIPGLGQMYKGQVFNGALWLVVVVCGYAMFIIPGICLHLMCIAGAAMGDPYK